MTDYRFKPESDEPQDDPREDVPAEDVEASDTQADEAEQPKPGDADFDWTKAYDTEDLFVHTFSDGKVVALRPFNAIYNKTWLYKLRNIESNDTVIILSIDRASCAEARLVLSGLDDERGAADPIDDLWKAWSTAGTSHSGEPDGEGLTAGN